MKFNIILADPPWKYDNPKDHKSSMGGTPYQQMSQEKLKQLPVNELASKNCALFMWATFPKLKEAFELIESWGFKYTTVAFVWIKTNKNSEIEYADKDILIKGGIYSGMGHWTNGNAEIVLFAKKGSPKRIKKNVKQIIIYPLAKHSRKPDVTRKRIKELLGDLPSIELFATEDIDGWTSVGNEIDGKDIFDALKEIINDN